MGIFSTEKKNSPMREVWRKLKKNKLAMISLSFLFLYCLIAIFAPFLAPYDYNMQDYNNTLQPPSFQHPLGTDNFGRDVFSRMIHGSRWTLSLGFGIVTVSAIIGVFLGMVAAYFSKLDNIIMRFLDIIIGMPTMSLMMLIIGVLGISVRNLIITICIIFIPAFARVARGQAMTVKHQEYIEASVAIGASNRRILFKHILPNSISPIFVQYSLYASYVVLDCAALSFIGLGIQPPTPEWGLMISTGRPYLMSNWYLAIIPGIAIVSLTFALNYLGDGLRDALDPRLNK